MSQKAHSNNWLNTLRGWIFKPDNLLLNILAAVLGAGILYVMTRVVGEITMPAKAHQWAVVVAVIIFAVNLAILAWSYGKYRKLINAAHLALLFVMAFAVVMNIAALIIGLIEIILGIFLSPLQAAGAFLIIMICLVIIGLFLALLAGQD